MPHFGRHGALYAALAQDEKCNDRMVALGSSDHGIRLCMVAPRGLACKKFGARPWSVLRAPSILIGAAMTRNEKDPEIITSRHSGHMTKIGVTVKLCVYRFEHTKWTLEVSDAEGTSMVGDDECETDDAAFAEFQKAIDHGMLEFQPTVSKRIN
jgi:hypothetical protein